MISLVHALGLHLGLYHALLNLIRILAKIQNGILSGFVCDYLINWRSPVTIYPIIIAVGLRQDCNKILLHFHYILVAVGLRWDCKKMITF